MHDKIVVFLQVWHQDIYVVDCIQIFFYLCFLGAALYKKATPRIHFLSITESKWFFRQAASELKDLVFSLVT